MAKKLRVAVFMNDDLTSHIIFRELFNNPCIEVTSVAFSDGFDPKQKGNIRSAAKLAKKMDKRYWLFLSAHNFIFKCTETLGSISERLLNLFSFTSIKLLCKQKKIKTFYLSDFNSTCWKKKLCSQQPDLIVARISAILDKEILSIPPQGVWVIHSSLLPAFKGIAGEFHAMRTNSSVGSTVFKASEKLDQGETLMSRQLPNHSKSLFSTIVANNILGANLLSEAVSYLQENGKPPSDIARHTLPDSYYTWPQKDEVASFYQKGLALMNCSDIKLFIRDSNA
jgi:hypothetical protein